MRTLGLLTFAFLCAQARGQIVPLLGQPAPPKPRPAENADPDGTVSIAANTDWRAWLSRHYPGREKAWPPEARESFRSLRDEERWDFVGTGDYRGGKTPAALLIRFLPPKEPDSGAVSEFVLAEWVKGRWTRPVVFGLKNAWFNGDRAPDMDSYGFGYVIDLFDGGPGGRGLSFAFSMANGDGVGGSDSADLYFSAKRKKFVMNDDFGQ